ncbi:MAG: valine--tRNA ligase [Candidatus Gracilibacteria bacterium]|jgi:valyl-tRNA synthetase|nr:valine--tRNA ligase [Candidatus Gracilibacteria bacterium]
MKTQLDTVYTPSKYEDEIYEKWEKSGAFTPEIDESKVPFVISMPPPNATGRLHLGHSLMLAIEDIMIRYNRMCKVPTLWLPGTDHASIATQTKVEKILLEKGITKESLGREAFMKEMEEYVENSKHIIRSQIKKMGSSCDWTRERYTLDKGLSNAVQEIFIRMYNDGLIYRGNRIVNWDPVSKTSIADDEVEYKEVTEKLYYIKYGPFEVATTRPETMLGDTAVAVNPEDERYQKYIGQKVKIPFPLGEFEVIVIGDKEVEKEFGTGMVKVTPAHSVVDNEMATRHNLEVKMVINQEGKMMDNCGKYAGMTTVECREKFVEDLKEMGLIIKIEDYTHNLSISYRSGAPIEPLISKQWFIDVNKKVINDNGVMKSVKEKSLEVVKNGEIKIIPERFEKNYNNWTENLRDWCISRQLWFGHRIPIYYCDNCENPIASKVTPDKCDKCEQSAFTQDPDTLDTWFSSGLWTFSTLGWPEKSKDLEYFHPTTVLETGYDIITFWVARMILMTTYALNDIPFKNVYLHGMIRDKQGRKMSKSLNNGIDPLDMIAKYGTDALRLGMILGNTPGNDLKIFEEKIESFRNFINKIWNASRFAMMNIEGDEKEPTEANIKTDLDKWILSKLNELVVKSNDNLKNFKLSECGLETYDFFWNTFCDWYLEMSKGENKNPVILKYILETLLKLLHPFAPFVTEKIWNNLEKENLLIAEEFPKERENFNFPEEAANIEKIKEIIEKIRSIRAEMKIEPAKKINAIIYCEKNSNIINSNLETLKKLARLEKIEITDNKQSEKNAKYFTVKEFEIFLPLIDMIDLEAEKKKLKEEIENKGTYIKSLETKLANKTFTDKAPKAIIEQTESKLKETKDEIDKLNAQLKDLD